MKYVYVLEAEEKFQNEIYEILISVDPQLCVRFFDTAESFSNWLKLALTDGNKALVRGGFRSKLDSKEVTDPNPDDQLVLMFFCNEILGLKQKELIRKIKQSFIDHKLCSAEAPTAFILTIFESPDLKFRQAEDRVFNNVLFKPFDKLVSQQHLICALEGHKKPSQSVVFNMKSKTEVEMLKRVPLEGISDVGFISRSDREISPGGYSKYYGDCFQAEGHIGVLAFCVQCIPHPTIPKEFQVYFSYFSIHQAQINNIRKIIKANLQKSIKVAWANPQPASSVNMVLVDPDVAAMQSLKETLERNFEGINILLYSDLTSFLREIDSSEIEKQIKSSAKGVPFENGIINLDFDLQGVHVNNIDPKMGDAQKFCNLSNEALMKTDFRTLMDESNKARWEKMIKDNKISSDPFFKITYAQQDFLIKVNSIEKMHKGSSDIIYIQIVEPTLQEKSKWYLSHSKLPMKLDGLFISDNYFGDEIQDKLNGILALLEKRHNETGSSTAFERSKVFLNMTSEKYNDLRAFCGLITEAFIKPIDKAYLIKKIKIHFPQLKNKEAIDLTTVLFEASIKSANPIELVEYSEAGLVMKYNRAIEIDSFREFMLPIKISANSLELLARCNFTEEVTGDQKGFINHFVFFGMRDHYLKSIRLWIRDTYINSKEGKG